MPVTMVSAPAELLTPPAVAPAAAPASAPSTVSTVSAAAGGFYLQLGAFSQATNAQAAQALHAQRWNGSLRQVDIVQNNTLFRLYGGPFASRADAEAVARQMQASGGTMPIIVQR
jgi:rare lipoprotein A